MVVLLQPHAHTFFFLNSLKGGNKQRKKLVKKSNKKKQNKIVRLNLSLTMLRKTSNKKKKKCGCNPLRWTPSCPSARKALLLKFRFGFFFVRVLIKIVGVVELPRFVLPQFVQSPLCFVVDNRLRILFFFSFSFSRGRGTTGKREKNKNVKNVQQHLNAHH